MYINTTPHVMIRHGHLYDLVYPTMHTEHERVYYRPAVGDYLTAPVDAEVTRLTLEGMDTGHAQVIAYQDGKTYKYEALDERLALPWAQHVASLNSDSDVHLQIANTRFYKVVVPNTTRFYEYVGLMATKSPTLTAYVIDTTLQERIYKTLLRGRILTDLD